jgi:acetyltransferase-like isoleucine patch superfamily enzyme
MMIKTIQNFINTLNLLGSFLMKLILKLNGAKIGKNTYISLSAKIVAKKLEIGDESRILSNVKIKGNKIVIGKNCIISDNVNITGKANFYLGDKSYVGKKVKVNISEDVQIGEDVGVGENSNIWTHGFFPPADEGFPVTYKPVMIKDNVWISTNVIILPGIILNEGTIVGAGSVVTKNFAPNLVIAGNPSKIIKPIQEIKSSENFIDLLNNIFSEHQGFSLIERQPNHIIFLHDDYLIYIIYKHVSIDLTFINTKRSIFILKDVDKNSFDYGENLLWINLTIGNREVVNSNNKELKIIRNILRDYGIRVLRSYSV